MGSVTWKGEVKVAKQQIKSAVHVVINSFSDSVARKYASDYAHRVDYGDYPRLGDVVKYMIRHAVEKAEKADE